MKAAGSSSWRQVASDVALILVAQMYMHHQLFKRSRSSPLRLPKTKNFPQIGIQ